MPEVWQLREFLQEPQIAKDIVFDVQAHIFVICRLLRRVRKREYRNKLYT